MSPGDESLMPMIASRPFRLKYNDQLGPPTVGLVIFEIYAFRVDVLVSG